MKQVILDVEDSKYNIFIALVKSLDFVKVQKDDDDSKEKIIESLAQSFKELKLYKEGKLKGIPAKELMDAL